MATHSPHPTPDGRREFLVDGCPRCDEYVRDLGVHFTPDRFRAFWLKMIEVEWDDRGGWASASDKALGQRLYLVTLALNRGFAMDPRLPLVVQASLVPPALPS